MTELIAGKPFRKRNKKHGRLQNVHHCIGDRSINKYTKQPSQHA